MKKIAILQSNYIPWKGYFDMIAAVDEFILYDDMQYTKNDWRNRNIIKTGNGNIWLTIPVGQDINRSISDVTVTSSLWQKKHLKSLIQSYSKAKFFKEIIEWVEPLYNQGEYTKLSDINKSFIKAICDYLVINTKISSSCDFNLVDGKTERLADLCKKAGGAEYISGPAARNYIDENVFEKQGIILSWFNYDGYKEYSQLHGSFEHGVSILDLLFNCGKNSADYMRYVKR